MQSPEDYRILLVEDNPMVVDSIERMLSRLGYSSIQSVADCESAQQILLQDTIHIVLIDILLSGKKTGIDLGHFIREQLSLPFIFITSNSDRNTVAAAKKVTPNGYLVKPFEKEDLFTAIEIALFNFSEQTSEPIGSKDAEGSLSFPAAILKDSIFIKKQHVFHRISYSDILYIKADNVYLEVYTKDQTFVVRSTLKDYHNKLPDQYFYRAHKSYIVNIEHIQAINAKDVMIDQKRIPITKDFKEFLLKTMNS